MKINQKFLEEIEQILYYGATGEKLSREANTLVDYVRLAHAGKLEKVPEKYHEFAQTIHCHWKNMESLSLEEQKKYLHIQIHGLFEHLKI